MFFQSKCNSNLTKRYTKNFKCFGRNCTSLRLEREFPIPKLITCWDSNVGVDSSSIDMLAFYRGTEEDKNHSNDSCKAFVISIHYNFNAMETEWNGYILLRYELGRDA